MNIRPWPFEDLPGAGPLGEHDIDAACWRKRQIVLTPEQCHAVDETAGLCGSCGGHCPAPQACEQPENLTGLPLEPYLRRHAWLGPLMVALIGFVWLCLDGYQAAHP